MYTTTFYSFKGGVGRSMALVNAAVELADRGRRVLVVDFDLEAPGLDTFDFLRTKSAIPGIIDFVNEYQTSNRAPDVSRFVGKTAEVGDNGGELWIMPSGIQGDAYARELNQIDWGELYEKRDGYLLFEDLRAQWKNVVDPDYVLIDSRTGHTDTSGICTRQLPDAVVILFFPNDQNLRGLTKVVRDIRSEKTTRRARTIDLHFVMSNVPDLDDEDSILSRKMEAFKDQLTVMRDPMVVHRYDSLSLLNQAIFVKTRPKSRLATEYRKIVERIVRGNLEDRDGALNYIERAGRRWRRTREESPGDVEKTLERIETLHAADGDVLFHLGVLREDERRPEVAGSLFDRSIEAGCNEPEAYLRRARYRRLMEDIGGAGEDALVALGSTSLPPPFVREAMDIVGVENLTEVSQLNAVSALDFESSVWLADDLRSSRRELRVAASVLEGAVERDDVDEDQRSRGAIELAMAYMGLGQCEKAMELLKAGELSVEELGRARTFNYGMAVWGATGVVEIEPFGRVVEMERTDPMQEAGSNYLQCMAIANWAVGDETKADDAVRSSGKALGRSAFSCWRYLQVSADEFRADLDEIQELIRGDASRKPRFARSIESGSGRGS